MAYDEGLAERIRGILADRPDVSEKKMFGGIAFMVRGHMCVGMVKDDLMVRVGPDMHEHLIRQSHARPMDFTGKPMKGFLYVDSAGLEADADLERWVGHGLQYALSLPAKASSGGRRSPLKALPRSSQGAHAMRGRARTIDEYLAAWSADKRATLQKLRKIIRAAAPKAEECISYGLAAFRQNGMLVGFGASANHCAFYLMSSSTIAAHKDALKGYDTSKGTIRFSPDKPLPAALVRKLVKARIAENGG